MDFDCLFDKGLTLARPEIVPFRLTPNMVDAMGVTGVEGTYRCTLQVALHILRDNKETLLSVLEPFLRDPTVAWTRSGRAQRERAAAAAVDAAGGSASRAGGAAAPAAPPAAVLEQEHKAAKEMLQKISDRLSGVYNIFHPYRDKFLKAAARRAAASAQSVQQQQVGGKSAAAAAATATTDMSGGSTGSSSSSEGMGLGASTDEIFTLSVQGQAQRLIDEAVAVENLSQLYVGECW